MSDAVLDLIDRVWCADENSTQRPTRSWLGNVLPRHAAERPALNLPGFEDAELIGQGGMGRVFRAFEPTLRRNVAIKTLLRQDAGHRERFRREAVAAAQLVHENIVQIHRVAEHEQQPYLVLEYVQGRPLSRRLAGRPQSPAVAAALVERIARAVEVAHQKGIVHRDLKPDNVLIVEPKPTPVVSEPSPALRAADMPKVTDFGLAKLDESLDPATLATADEHMVGTLAYASPEQVSRGFGSISPATDVHALGVILYEMLTGVRPFAATDLQATITRITADEPLSPDRVQPQVPRDLATICLQCLRKKPADRYASAVDLADDLRRFLEHRPVRARRISPAERLLKWARREPWIAGLSSTLVVLVAASLVGAGLLVRRIVHHAERAEANAVRAQSHATAAMEAYNQIAFQIQDKLRHQPATQPLRKELLESAYQGLTRLEQSADVPGAQPQRALAAIQLNRAEMAEMMGKLTEAAAAYERAQTSFESLAAQTPQNAQAVFDLAAAHNRLGAISRKLRRFDDATRHHRRDLELMRQLLAEKPSDQQLQRNLATSLVGAGDLALETADNTSALQYFQEALVLDRQLAKSTPNPATYRNLAISLGRVADLQTPDAAQANIEEALRIYQDHVPGALGRDGEAVCRSRLGRRLVELRKFSEARQHLTTALTLRETLREADSTNAHNLWQLVAIHQDLGGVEAEEKRFAEALEHFSAGQTLCDGFLAQDERNSDAHYEGGVCREQAAVMLQELQRDAEARDRFAEAREHYDAALQLDPQHPEARAARERVQGELAKSGAGEQKSERQTWEELQRQIVAAVRAERYARARELVEQAQSRLSAVRDDKLRTAAETNLATLRTYVAEAERAMTDADSIPREPVVLRSMLLTHRGCVLADRGEHAAAAEVAEQMRQLRPESPENYYNAATVYALCHRAVAKSGMAESPRLAEYRELAFRTLIKAIAGGFRDRSQLESDPDWEHLRSDAAFQRTLQVLAKPL